MSHPPLYTSHMKIERDNTQTQRGKYDAYISSRNLSAHIHDKYRKQSMGQGACGCTDWYSHKQSQYTKYLRRNKSN